jgi:WD40 repeat protein
MRGHGGAVWSLCAHPRERLLFSAAADATVRVWDTQGLAERACLRADGVAPRVPTCVQLQHGALLAAFVDGGLAAFDVESGACTQLSAEQGAPLPCPFARYAGRFAEGPSTAPVQCGRLEGGVH